MAYHLTGNLPNVGQDIWCHLASRGSQWINTLRPRQHDRHFADDNFKHILLNNNVIILFRISLSNVFLRVQLTTALVQIMAWCLAPARRQASIWSNDGKFTDSYMRHSASMNKYVKYARYPQYYTRIGVLSCVPFPVDLIYTPAVCFVVTVTIT